MLFSAVRFPFLITSKKLNISPAVTCPTFRFLSFIHGYNINKQHNKLIISRNGMVVQEEELTPVLATLFQWAGARFWVSRAAPFQWAIARFWVSKFHVSGFLWLKPFQWVGAV